MRARQKNGKKALLKRENGEGCAFLAYLGKIKTFAQELILPFKIR